MKAIESILHYDATTSGTIARSNARRFIFFSFSPMLIMRLLVAFILTVYRFNLT